MNPGRGIATVGDSEDIGTWSGIPYYLLQASLEAGFLTSGLNLRVANIQRLRGVWQFKRLLQGERPRGFQYSSNFLDLLGKQAMEECERRGLQEVVSHFQVLPAGYLMSHSVATSFYIDSTLRGLFETHGMLSWLNARIVEEVLDKETEGYRAAKHLVTMSSWVSASLQSNYGIASERIVTILPGANLPEREVRLKLEKSRPSSSLCRLTRDRRLRVGFIGKDWKRKGLPRLVRAIELLNRMGIPSEVIVIGHVPKQYRSHAYVRVAGFIDKSRELSRFIDIVASCDLGCAPSHEEPLGIAPLEFLRLGVPVVCADTGGLKDVCKAAGPASILLNKDATPEDIALAIEAPARHPDILQRMRTAAFERKEHFSWDRTVKQMGKHWETDRSVRSQPAYPMAQRETAVRKNV